MQLHLNKNTKTIKIVAKMALKVVLFISAFYLIYLTILANIGHFVTFSRTKSDFGNYFITDGSEYFYSHMVSIVY